MRAESQADSGMRHLAARRYGNAVICFGWAIRLDGDNAGYRVGRALGYSRLGEYERAVEDFTDAIAIDPRLVAAHRGRGIAYAMRGDHEMAPRP